MVLRIQCDAFKPHSTILGLKIILSKNSYFSLKYIMAPTTLFWHIGMENGCQLQNQSNHPEVTKTRINNLWRHHRSFTPDDLGWPRKGNNVGVNHGCHLATPIHVLITSKNTELRKFQAYWNGTERKFRLTWPWKSGHRSKVIAIIPSHTKS